MTDIKSDLQAYLSSTRNTSSAINGSGKSSTFIPLPSVKSWFSAGGDREKSSPEPDEEPLMNDQDSSSNGWFNSAQKDPLCPSLSKKQRIIGFMLCLLSGVGCFVLAWLFLPLIALKPTKFAVLYTMGSIFTLGSFSLLWGPMNHLKHLCSSERLPFTAAYFGTIFATLYFVFIRKSTLMTILCSICQLVALLWYIVSYIPGGQKGLTFFTKLFASLAGKTISKSMPV